jgi:hypothetical protein
MSKRTLWDKFWGIKTLPDEFVYNHPSYAFGDYFFAVILRLYGMLFLILFLGFLGFCTFCR